jgi:hypothetical protein
MERWSLRADAFRGAWDYSDSAFPASTGVGDRRRRRPRELAFDWQRFTPAAASKAARSQDSRAPRLRRGSRRDLDRAAVARIFLRRGAALEQRRLRPECRLSGAVRDDAGVPPTNAAW